MKLKVEKQPDWRLESLFLLQHMTKSTTEDEGYSFMDVREECANASKRMGLKSAEQEALFGVLCEFYQAAIAEVSLPEETLAKYFTQLYPAHCSLGYIAYLMEICTCLTGKTDAGTRRRMLFDVIRFTLVENHEAANLTSTENDDPMDLVEWLATRDFDESIRWRILDFYINFDSCAACISAALDVSLRSINRHRHLADDLVKNCVARIEDGGSTILTKGVVSGFDAEIILPTVLDYASVNFFEFKNAAAYGIIFPARMTYGVIIDPYNDIKKVRMIGEENLLRQLHALDDRSRLQILIALRKRPMYGYELAGLTGLSAATISHHMNELFNREFVEIEKQGTSLRYSLRHGNLEKLVETLRDVLL